MLVGSYGLFWERDYVDWESRGWRLLGRRGLNRRSLQVVDFRHARGVYLLYGDLGVWYAGLAAKQGIGERLRDHLSDHHDGYWTRFSWFAFDSPGTEAYADGVLKTTTHGGVDLGSEVLIRDLEALLQHATKPFGNRSQTRFADASEWQQVPTSQPDLWTFDWLAPRLSEQSE